MTMGSRAPGAGSAIAACLAFAALVSAWAALGCAPRVQIEAPDKPIVIQIKIEHEVRVRVDRELEDLFESNEDLFGDSA